jgi:hypothetical protein
MKKIVSVGTSKCQLFLADAFRDNESDIEFHNIKILPNTKELLNIDDLWHIQNCDALVTWGTWGSTHRDRQYNPDNNKRQAWGEFLNRFIVSLSKSYNKKMLVFETPTLSRIRTIYSEEKNYKLTGKRYYRLGLNHWTYGKAKWCQPGEEDRLEKLISLCPEISNIYDHAWRNNKNGLVLVLPGLEHDPTSTLPVDKFVLESVEKIKQRSKRRILVKPHPLSSIDYVSLLRGHPQAQVVSKEVTLDSLFHEIYCAVLDNSTSIFELINLGIPCFTHANSFGRELGNTDLSYIENIQYAHRKEVLQWYQHMSYTEFTHSEISSAYIFDKIKELLS